MHTSSVQPVSKFAIVDDEHPWPGLASFREQEARFFKGRKRDIEKLHRLVNRERLTVLFGVSGLGKSSLLQAGLFPRLRLEHTLPVIIRLDFTVASVSLREQVFASIARQVWENAIEAPAQNENETLWEYFHRKDSEFWDTRNRITVPLLCFDQFEEIFTFDREDQKRASDSDNFILELADLVEDRCPESVKARLDANPDELKNFRFSHHRYKLIFSLREDYLVNLEELRELMPSIIHNRMRLRPMNGNQAFAVADQTGGRLMESSVAETVVRQVAGKHGEQQRELANLSVEPALLSLVCSELNERRIASQANLIDAQTVANNREQIEQILDNFYERSLSDQPPELRRFIEDKLITVSGLRNSEAYDNALETPGITAESLATLVQRRLLVLRLEERDNVKRIELIHDVLTGVVHKSRNQRQTLEKQRRDEQARLEAEQRAKAANRRTMVFVALAVIFLLTAAWGWWNWWDAKKSRNIALSGKLAAQAAQLAETAPDDSIVERAAALAIESWHIRHNAEASSAANKLLRMLPKYRIKHDRAILSIALSPDGSMLATGSEDKMLRVFKTEYGNELYRIKHGDWVTVAAFSPDGRFIATGCKDKKVRLIDIASRQEIFSLVQDDEVSAVSFSPNGRLLATAGKDYTARLIDALTGTELSQIKHGDEVFNIAFSPDSRILATASKDKTARLIDTTTGKELVRVDHEAEVTHVAFSVDGRLLATASDNTARLIDAATGKELRQIHHSKDVSSLDFSPDGLWLATGSNDKTARVTAVNNGNEIVSFSDKDDVYSVRFSPNGLLLAISSLDGTARFIETDTWQELTRIMHGGAVWNIVFSRDSQLLATVSQDKALRLIETVKNPDDIMIKQNAAIMGIAFSPNGRFLATASEDKTARMFEITTGKEVMIIEHADTVYGVAFSGDGRLLATSSKDNTAKLIDVITGKELTKVNHNDEVRALAFSPDSRWLATASMDQSIKVVETATGKEVRQIANANEVRFIVFSFDGQLLAIASKDGAKLIDTKTWQPTHSIKLAASVSRVAFSPDGRFLATASEDNMARLIEIATGVEKARFQHAGAVLSVAFSPDGKLLATSSLDNTARLIDINTGKTISLIKHGGVVKNIAFSPSGRFFATASVDGITRLIETESGLEVGQMSYVDDVWAVAFSPDEKLLASAVSNGDVRLHDADPQRVFDLLCSKAGRNLNRDELHDYLGINAPQQTCKDWRGSEAAVATP